MPGMLAQSPLASPRGVTNSHHTMTEEELSESLIYLTCPICECVFSEEPVFAPCHHTFCNKCIRERINSGDNSCPECRRPLKESELQPNAMAIELLRTMKTICIHKSNGCRWKGLVRELDAHTKVCKFAVTHCPYGCGVQVDRNTIRQHQKICENRPIKCEACRNTLMFKDREAHESRCLPFLQQKLPQVVAERQLANESIRALTSQLIDLKVDSAERRAQSASATAATLLISLALLSIAGQAVRPDASLAVALALLLAVTARNTEALRTLGWLLPLASLVADAIWFFYLGPRISSLSAIGLGPSPNPTGEESAGESEDEDAVRDQLALAYVAAAATVKALIMLLPSPLIAALSEAETATNAPLPSYVAAEGQPLLPVSTAVNMPLLNGHSSRSDGIASASATTTTQVASCSHIFLEGLGRTLLVLSMISSVARPDAGAALALLILSALPESRLYFSRVLLGAAMLTISLDVGWLHMQAFPQLSLTDLSTALISPSQLSTLIATLEDGNTRLGVYTTLLSLPIKLILALAAIHLSCLPHVAEQRPFRFVMPAALVGTPNGNTPRGGEEASSAAPASAPVTAEPVLVREGSNYSHVLPYTAAGGLPYSARDGEKLTHEQRAERRRQSAIAREATSLHESQLEIAKRGFTLCFLALLLAATLACMRNLAGGVDLGSPEAYVFALLACYSCLRHSVLCASDPERCRAVLAYATTLVIALLFVDGVRVISAGVFDLSRWTQLPLTDKVYLAVSVAILLLLILLTLTLVRLSHLLGHVLLLRSNSGDAAFDSRLPKLTSKVQSLAILGLTLSAFASCVRRDADAAAFCLALFATAAFGEADARNVLAAIARAAASPRAARRDYSWSTTNALGPPSARGDPLAQQRAELAARRTMFCLAPDSTREHGGLLTATILLCFTAVLDAYWALLALPDFDNTASSSSSSSSSTTTIAAPTTTDASFSAAALSYLASLWVPLERYLLNEMHTHMEIFLICGKLLLKASFGIASIRLMLTPRRPQRASEEVVEGFIAAERTSAGGGLLLYMTCAMLLLLASLHCALNSILEYPVQSSSSPPPPALEEVATTEMTAAPSSLAAVMYTTEHDIALGLAAGPPAAIAVLGCALALGAGGKRLAALLAAAAFSAAVANCGWLSFGPLGFSFADLTALAEGHAATRWASLPQAIMVPAVVLLLEAPLELGVAAGAAYRAWIARV